MSNKPIGIFDSGLGGLSVWDELKQLLPHEDFVYFADSKFCPYGEKKQMDIVDRSSKIAEELLTDSCKLIIVACNTATAAAIEPLREKFDIPFVGMEPAIKPAAMASKTGKIGILATEGTFNGELFKNTHEKYAQNVETITQPGYGLVELVELGQQYSADAKYLLHRYLSPMLEANADHIVLGCTHYPFYKDLLNELVPDDITIVNPAPAIALRTQQLLQENGLINRSGKNGETKFLTSGIPDNLSRFVEMNFEIQVSADQIFL